MGKMRMPTMALSSLSITGECTESQLVSNLQKLRPEMVSGCDFCSFPLRTAMDSEIAQS